MDRRQPTPSDGLRTKRIYEPPEAHDGQRVLVDRVWPRGVSRARAQLTAWLPEAGPSTALRKWFSHEPARWDEFRRRYFAELDGCDAVEQIEVLLNGGPVTLLYSARETEHNQALALADYLRARGSR